MVRTLHYVERWLDLSAGFVHSHVTQSRSSALVVSREPLVNVEAFPFTPTRALAPLLRVTPAAHRSVVRRRALRALAAAYRIDVVHVHFGYAAGDVVPLVRRTQRPFVLSLHGHDATAVPRNAPEHYRHVVDAVDAVIVPSQHFAEVVQRLGFDAKLLHVIPAGVDTEVFAPVPPARGEPVVTFIGRLVEKKGLDVILAAWPRVRAAVPTAHLHVVGEGPLDALLSPLPDGVAHARPDPGRRQDQVREALAAAAVVVTPSRTAADGDGESLLLVNLEAQATGRPVVTTAHGGIPEYVVDGESALVVPEGDPAALAEALVRVLTDPVLAARMAAAGPAVARRFDVRHAVERVDDLYDELVARRDRR